MEIRTFGLHVFGKMDVLKGHRIHFGSKSQKPAPPAANAPKDMDQLRRRQTSSLQKRTSTLNQSDDDDSDSDDEIESLAETLVGSLGPDGKPNQGAEPT